MKLIDLKLSKKEKKERSKDMAVTESSNAYPWGLNINLHKDSISKLGLDLKSFKIGQKLMISAEVVVSEIRQSKDMYDESENLGLQIQKIGLNKGKSKFGKYNDTQKAGPG